LKQMPLYREAPTFPFQTLWALHTTAVNLNCGRFPSEASPLYSSKCLE
jgi:hypothetical protein